MPPRNEPSDVFQHYAMGSDDECWPYTGPSWGGREWTRRPYFQVGGRRQAAYRWVYELVNGVTLTPDQFILHSCDNGGFPIGCGNPQHMRIGTNDDNMVDMKQRQRHGLPHHVVAAIRTLLAQGREQQEIATLYGVSRECIRDIAIRKNYRHVPD